ncbi:MAG: DUF4157 domain-containing protein [Methanothrix sp.]
MSLENTMFDKELITMRASPQSQNKPSERALFDSSKLDVVSKANNKVHPIINLQNTVGNRAVQRLLWTFSQSPRTNFNNISKIQRDHVFEQTSINPRSLVQIKAKIGISVPGDSHEQEADRIANHIMRMKDPSELNFKTDSRCNQGHRCNLAYKNSNNTKGLNPKLRQFFEPRLGYNLGNVRIHLDRRANESASLLHARAYTVGNNIAFAAGEYRPETREGKRLLAHELVHVVQQAKMAENIMPHSVASSLSRTAGRLIQRLTEAFYTTGDTELLWPSQCPNLTREEMYRRFAVAQGGQAHPASNFQGIIQGVQQHSVNRLLFIGHGGVQTNFCCSGSRRTGENFICSSIINANDTNLLNAIEQSLSWDAGTSIEFYVCNTIGSALVERLCDQIGSSRRAAQANSVFVKSSQGLFNFRTEINPNCDMVNFGPSGLSIMECGRNPQRRRHP